MTLKEVLPNLVQSRSAAEICTKHEIQNGDRRSLRGCTGCTCTPRAEKKLGEGVIYRGKL